MNKQIENSGEKQPRKKSAKATAEPHTADAALAGDETAPTVKPRVPRLSPELRAKAQEIVAKRDRKAAKAERKRGEPKEELVVFAFRLTPEERELIHKAAGAAKASRFVRSLAVAGAAGDAEAVKLILEHVGSSAA